MNIWTVIHIFKYGGVDMKKNNDSNIAEDNKDVCCEKHEHHHEHEDHCGCGHESS